MQPRPPLPRLDDGERRKAPRKAGWKCAPRGTPRKAGDGDDDPRRGSAERWSTTTSRQRRPKREVSLSQESHFSLARAGSALHTCRAAAVRLGDTPEKRLVPPPPKVVVVALRNRLGAAIAKDWLAAAGQAVGRHSTDARASAARPSSVEEFQERWGSVSEVSDGKCTPRPRRLEEMEPD